MTEDDVVLVRDDLIFDVGFHRGEDSAFYLAEGFSVVAVEANPDLVELGRKRFADAISEGRLVLEHAAVATAAGPVTFYAHDHTDWGTTDPEWAERNTTQYGAPPSATLTVPGVTFGTLLARHGIPHYLKIDIEGADLLCLEALRGDGHKPTYVSIESDKRRWRGIRKEFDLLQELGYTRFKVVNQAKVPEQVPPVPWTTGAREEARFPLGSSGMFGDAAPGRWLGRRMALLRYAAIHVRYRLYGDYGVFRFRPGWGGLPARALQKAFGPPAWYDTHAGR
jgi:FkbM family methyltransferase